MPKKKSYGGEQEYIPAGNGLASGTYADDSGNNAWHSQGKNTDKAPLSRMSKPKQPKPQQPNQPQNTPVPNVNIGAAKSNGLQRSDFVNDWEYNDYISAKKVVDNSQTETDKQIQNIFGGNCLVCFGDKIDDEKKKAFVETAQKMVADFPVLKGMIRYVGERTKINELGSAKYKVDEWELSLDENRLELAIQEWIKDKDNKSLYDAMAWRGEEGRREQVKQFILLDHSAKKFNPFSISQGSYAYATTLSGDVIFMNKGCQKTLSVVEEQFNNNFKSSNKINSTFAHEMGHQIGNCLLRKANELKKDHPELSQKTDDFIQKLTDLYHKNLDVDVLFGNKQGKLYNVSQYGGTTDSEFIAECFSAYYGDMNNPLANEVFNLFKGFQKELEGYENGI